MTQNPNISSQSPQNKQSIWTSFIKFIKKGFYSFEKSFENFNIKFPNIAQNIEVTCIYFCAIVDLIYVVLTNVFNLGYFPEILAPIYPIIQAILTSPVLRIWASPEKTFFMSQVVIELMVIRSLFKFSKLVKYNIVLVFSLVMIQGLILSFWELLFHRDIATAAAQWSYDQGPLLFLDKVLGIKFFLATFIVFLIIYIFLYILALQGKFVTFTQMRWLTDSVAFWLRIRTPSMGFGKRKKK
jgi:hypothetical protein